MKRSVLLALLVAIVATSSAAAEVPTSITVQGKLTDSTGVPLPAGMKIFGFRIFSSESSGLQIWPNGGVAEPKNVFSDADGLWSASIGTFYHITDLVFVGGERWLDITVDGTTLPRVRLLNTPTSFRVATVDSATGGEIKGNLSVGGSNDVSGINSFAAGQSNTASGFTSSVTGGELNVANGDHTIIGGGYGDTASASYAIVSGGVSNHASAQSSTIGGGSQNRATGNHSTVDGGIENSAVGEKSAIGGGFSNNAAGSWSVIGGGGQNNARGQFAVVGGGGGIAEADSNSAIANYSAVSGGLRNVALALFTTVSGGQQNVASGHASVISGGEQNRAIGPNATVGGGFQDTASGSHATVPGGRLNVAGPGQGAFAAGWRAKARHNGTFVWADLTEADFASTAANQFLIRASGGVGIGTTSPQAALHVSGGGGVRVSGESEGLRIQGPDVGNSNGAYASFHDAAGTALGYVGDGSGSDNDMYLTSYVSDVNLYTPAGATVTASAAGNVGILNASPTNILTVQQFSTTDPIADGWGLYSSRRWKDNIHPIDGALELVSQLQGVRYHWKKTKEADIGLIAEDVGKVIPEVVAYEENGVDAKSVDYARLVALLIEAVKEQNQRLDAQQAEITTLRREIQTNAKTYGGGR